MAKNKNIKHEDSMQEVEQALTKTEQFLENHLNLVLYVIGGIIVVILGVLGIQRYYVSPKNAEAQEQIYGAQNHFSKDSFNLALNGDGVSLGFLDIIDNYSSTDAGKLAQYYAGISYLHLGDYEAAITHLKKFKTDDLLVAPLAQSALGDAYVELEEYNKAITAYNKALKISDNNFTSPSILNKLALVYEKQGDTAKALEIYKQIKKDYPSSPDAVNVEKSIARIQQNM
ncbi:MAG: tetratricopeptide repeat protein [Prolixibacteraceae bacterium]|nr:tetratricopeptide repeat protein [Prolixibacteraceae bacterium]MBN2649184.1 tetratricopeptide repeat protein [Prolixibacteraceae bacterium]